MDTKLQEAVDAINSYTFGMDTSDWELAVSRFADMVDVDYSAVGAPKSQMSQQQLQAFLQGLLGRENLRVHTSVSQVFQNPANSSEFIAYYSVRHYKGEIGQATKFAVFGWYSYRMRAGLIDAFTINVSAMEGDPSVLTA